MDEIGEAPPALQVRLLRFLDNGRFRRVGEVQERESDVRVLAATNTDPKLDIENKKFREVTLKREHDLTAPQGVAGRNSDNTFIQQVLGWEPTTPLEEGLKKTYDWIEQQYRDRKAGKRTVS